MYTSETTTRSNAVIPDLNIAQNNMYEFCHSPAALSKMLYHFYCLIFYASGVKGKRTVIDYLQTLSKKSSIHGVLFLQLSPSDL